MSVATQPPTSCCFFPGPQLSVNSCKNIVLAAAAAQCAAHIPTCLLRCPSRSDSSTSAHQVSQLRCSGSCPCQITKFQAATHQHRATVPTPPSCLWGIKRKLGFHCFSFLFYLSPRPRLPHMPNPLFSCRGGPVCCLHSHLLAVPQQVQQQCHHPSSLQAEMRLWLPPPNRQAPGCHPPGPAPAGPCALGGA